jgi:hypothetical protein
LPFKCDLQRYITVSASGGISEKAAIERRAEESRAEVAKAKAGLYTLNADDP